MALHIDIVSPTEKVASLSATQVVVPGAEGDFGVLDLHAPMVSTLREGVVDLYQGDKKTVSYQVSGGFVEVDGAACTILAPEAQKVSV